MEHHHKDFTKAELEMEYHRKDFTKAETYIQCMCRTVINQMKFTMRFATYEDDYGDGSVLVTDTQIKYNV